MSTAQDNAPTGANGDASPQWPAPHEWPTVNASPCVVARFIRDHLGLRPYPTPNAADVAASAKYIFVNAVADWKADRGGADMTADERCELQDIADREADATRKGPLARLHTSFTEAATITDAMIDRAWGGANADRGIAVQLGRSTKGFPLAQLDVDPRHGGDIIGALPASLADGLVAVTPGGGLHVFVLADPTLRPQVSGALAPGVELRTTGYAMMPSGSSSAASSIAGASHHGRSWVSTGRPPVAPASLRKAVHRVGAAAKASALGGGISETGGGAGGDDGPAPDVGSGRAALAIASEVGDGERNASASIIVGLLARPGSVPEDARHALMLMLSEHLTGRDAPASVCREAAEEWTRALTRGPRDASFAADVIEAWASVRDQSPRPWRMSKARAVARSLWRTADRRLGGEAGAEDLGEGPPLGVAPSWAPTPPPHPAIAPLPAEDIAAVVAQAQAHGPASDYAINGPTPEQARAALAATTAGLGFTPAALAAATRPPPTGKAAIDLRKLFVPLGEMYGAAEMAIDEARKPVRVAKLPPFVDFLKGGPDESYPSGYGMGPWFGRGLGGLVAGDMKAFGAAGAKAGKTYFVGQMLDGLAIQTAYRLMGIPGYEDAPIVLVFWVSEMAKKSDLPMRFVSRALGYDAKVTTQGVDAVDSVSLAALRIAGMMPAEYVTHARRLRAWHQNPGLDEHDIADMMRAEFWPIMLPHLAMRRALLDCTRVIDMSILPDAEGHGRGRIIHDGGPRLVAYAAEAMALARSEFCERHHIAEADVLCVVCCDPAQRFAGDDGHDSKAALDGMIRAWSKHVCRADGLNGAVLFTSDTTKAAVKEMDLGRFCQDAGNKVIAEIFAGSQAIAHECDCVGLMAETTPDTETTGRALMRARVLSGRTGASSEIYPFSWELHTGRFRPMDPKSVPIPEREDRPAFGSGGGGGRRPDAHGQASPAAPLGVRPAKNQPLRPPPRYGGHQE